MVKPKVKSYLLWGSCSVLGIFVLFAIIYNIYYPQIKVPYKVAETIKDDTIFNDNSILVSKDNDEFIGVADFISPDSLRKLFSQQEHLELFQLMNHELYNDFTIKENNYLVHVQILEKRRLFFEKVYEATMSVYYEGYYIQESFYFDVEGNSIDFKNEEEVKSVASEIAKKEIETYGHQLDLLNQYFKN